MLKQLHQYDYILTIIQVFGESYSPLHVTSSSNELVPTAAMQLLEQELSQYSTAVERFWLLFHITLLAILILIDEIANHHIRIRFFRFPIEFLQHGVDVAEGFEAGRQFSFGHASQHDGQRIFTGPMAHGEGGAVQPQCAMPHQNGAVQ